MFIWQGKEGTAIYSDLSVSHDEAGGFIVYL